MDRLVDRWVFHNAVWDDPPSFSSDHSAAWKMEEVIQDSPALRERYCREMFQVVALPTKSAVGTVGFNVWALVHTLPVVRARCAVVAAMAVAAEG